ncbi:DUF2971 domain-containing protein [Cupriavidus sp. WGlv3]|uniref:DUF2971 domain-containing protein n=1 Tax=Cupriavidus sp. WGlv3 TaxID=2919924 RepID=UPI002091850D|nr:DUF2971 domain-containing protein [Cupriavidus sp. WGlv3]MCO4863725.1 DUF2971 domain-containing protein [Cupriavidus sp. WGlv3]
MNWKENFVKWLFPLDANQMRIEAAFLLKLQNLPKNLYKYREVNEHSINNLKSNTIWLADPRTFNDPYDCSHFVDHMSLTDCLIRTLPQPLRNKLPSAIIEEFERRIADSSHSPYEVLLDVVFSAEPNTAVINDAKKSVLAAFDSVMQKNLDRTAEAMKGGFKVCSFSERNDSTLMWAHYAKYHTGFCIEYDISAVNPAEFTSRFMYPVIYKDTPFEATENISRVDMPGFNNLYLNLAALIKSVDWAYEREWRLIFANGTLENEQTWRMPKPTAVYLGSHISKENQSLLTTICQKNFIPLFKMKHARSTFAMTPTKV